MTPKYLLALSIGVGAVVCLPTPASAQVGGGGMFYACVRVDRDNEEGRIPRLVAAGEACRRNETRLHWVEVGTAGPVGAPGIQGPIGPMGPQGLVGPQGPAGPQGPQGVQGPEGPQGPQGPQGPAGLNGTDGHDGATGATGDKGDKGDTGDKGLNFAGAWNAAAAYVKDDVVTFGGSTWIADLASQGSQPDAAAPAWLLVAGKGDKGDKGDKGNAGLDGLPGAQGLQGPQGVTGPAGPTGAAGTTGQSVTTLFGSGGLAFPSNVGGFFYLTGLAPTTISIPANAQVMVTTTGGLRSQSTTANGYSVFDVALLIDGGTPTVNGNSVANISRVTAINPASGSAQGYARWSITYALSLPAGNHTFGVAAAIVGAALGAGADIGGGAGTALQAQLTVLVLKQ